MAEFDFVKKMEISKKRLTHLDQMAAMDLYQPWSRSVSGARKLLASTQRIQALTLFNPEVPYIGTGYENRYGDESSSIVKLEEDEIVLAKIPKYSFSPNHHYYLIVKKKDRDYIDIHERISYKHQTEHYGYLYNNTLIDSILPNTTLPKGTIIRKSLSYDAHMNQCTGVNLITAYLSLDQNMEDSIIISKPAAMKLASPLLKVVPIMIAENDIPINYYGNNERYKVMPDIGEEIKNSILLDFRKDKKEDALYMQSLDRLKTPLMVDDKYLLNGTVLDINILCNKPESLSAHYNAQFRLYYEEQKRFASEIVNTVVPLVANGMKKSYALDKIYGLSKRVLNNTQYLDKRQFSNIELKITVLERRELQVGDKISNRFGGKGVVSEIREVEDMPRMPDGTPVDIIMNPYGVVGRENPPQLFETESNFFAHQICNHIIQNHLSAKESQDLITKYISFINPELAREKEAYWNSLSESSREISIGETIQSKHINVTAEVLEDTMTLDRMEEMYDAFPFVQPVNLLMPLQDSKGNIQHIPSRKAVIAGSQYFLRLKQYAEEKFSATALSATNIRNENSKSKAARDYRILYSNTPIRLGNMEILDLSHIGSVPVISALLLHSVSPHGRKLVEQFSIGDPYITDIKLDNESVNRSAEILAPYLKVAGLRIKFTKTPKKKRQALKFYNERYNQNSFHNPIIEVPKDLSDKEKEEYVKKEEKRRRDFEKKYASGKYKDPLIFYDVPKYIMSK